MQAQGKIQKWGNSSAIRLPAKMLAAAGITNDSEVDIQAEKGRLVIQLPEQTKEQLLDKVLAEEPGAVELLAAVKQNLARAIQMTNDTTEKCLSLSENLEKLDQKEMD